MKNKIWTVLEAKLGIQDSSLQLNGDSLDSSFLFLKVILWTEITRYCMNAGLLPFNSKQAIVLGWETGFWKDKHPFLFVSLNW